MSPRIDAGRKQTALLPSGTRKAFLCFVLETRKAPAAVAESTPDPQLVTQCRAAVSGAERTELSKVISIIITMTINPWINFNGNAEEAFNFYKSVFGGEFTKIIRLKDLASREFSVAEKDANKIIQIVLPVGGANKLIGNDVPEFMGKVNENENRSKINIDAGSKEEAEKIFNGLSAGGQVEAPMSDSPWGTYFGMFRDKYGIEWVVEFVPGRQL